MIGNKIIQKSFKSETRNEKGFPLSYFCPHMQDGITGRNPNVSGEGKLFISNEAATDGGAIVGPDSDSVIVNCIFLNNKSLGSGGAINSFYDRLMADHKRREAAKVNE